MIYKKNNKKTYILYNLKSKVEVGIFIGFNKKISMSVIMYNIISLNNLAMTQTY